MLVKDSNKDKINEMIKKAEGRATERTITFDNIVSMIEKIESRLGISKTAMEGIVAYVDYNSQNFPNSYRWTANSTHFRIIRKKSGWDVTDIWRGTCRGLKRIRLDLTETAKAAIIEANEAF